jgi:hypothetical protein
MQHSRICSNSGAPVPDEAFEHGPKTRPLSVAVSHVLLTPNRPWANACAPTRAHSTGCGLMNVGQTAKGLPWGFGVLWRIQAFRRLSNQGTRLEQRRPHSPAGRHQGWMDVLNVERGVREAGERAGRAIPDPDPRPRPIRLVWARAAFDPKRVLMCPLLITGRSSQRGRAPGRGRIGSGVACHKGWGRGERGATVAAVASLLLAGRPPIMPAHRRIGHRGGRAGGWGEDPTRHPFTLRFHRLASPPRSPRLALWTRICRCRRHHRHHHHPQPPPRSVRLARRWVSAFCHPPPPRSPKMPRAPRLSRLRRALAEARESSAVMTGWGCGTSGRVCGRGGARGAR